MAKQSKVYNPEPDSSVLRRYQQGAGRAVGLLRKNRQKKQTRGKDKNPDTCQLAPLCGMPRKFWTSARAYKHPMYAKAMAFFSELKGNGKN